MQCSFTLSASFYLDAKLSLVIPDLYLDFIKFAIEKDSHTSYFKHIEFLKNQLSIFQCKIQLKLSKV